MDDTISKPLRRFGILVALVVAVPIISYYFMLQKKESQVIVAIIDTGIDLNDHELVDKILTNSGDSIEDGIDSDQNIYIDDQFGWNFWDSNADIDDLDGHGTNLARTIMNIDSRVRIIPIKISDHGKGIRASDLIKSLQYAVSRGAKIINVSFGITEASHELDAVIEELRAKNIFLVVSAGVGVPNPNRPVLLSNLTPQKYSYPFVVAEAEVDKDVIVSNSNYGTQIDLAIRWKDSKINRGSSFAAAIFSGLLVSEVQSFPDSDLTSDLVWSRLSSRFQGMVEQSEMKQSRVPLLVLE